MADLSFRKTPALRYLVDNPVMFQLITPAQQPAIEFEITIAGVSVYTGIFIPAGNDPDFLADIPVQDILKPHFLPLVPLDPDALFSEVANMFIDFTITFTQDDVTLTHSARVYRGGVSKQMLRFLNDEGSDIFFYKLINTKRQFFMTTRTGGNTVTVRDTEPAPLCFIATGKQHVVTANTGDTYTFPPTEPGNVYAFHLDTFLKSLPVMPNEVTIPLFMSFVMKIRIVPAARVPDRFVIEFLNSYAVPERIEVTGQCIFEPELADDNAYDVYDVTVDDYQERNERRRLREIVDAEAGYRTREEFFFLRDMLQSDRLYLIDEAGSRREVRVKAENFAHNVWPREPESVKLNIRMVDDDTQFTPERAADDDSLEKIFMATLNVLPGKLLNMLPFAGNVNLTVDWGDGVTEVITADFPQHTYAAAGEYVVAAAGHADRMDLSSNYSPPPQIANFRQNLTGIDFWGDLGLQNLSSACTNCVNLVYIETKPKYLFQNVTQAMYMFSACSKLEAVFERMNAPLLESVAGFCNGCTSLQALSESLLASCGSLKNVNSAFSTCSSLTSVSIDLVSNNLLLEDAANMFTNCYSLTNAISFRQNTHILTFEATFQTCPNLVYVPDYCFENSMATNFLRTFESCSSLTSLPVHLLAGATEVLAFGNFCHSSGLTAVPESLFSDCTKVTNFASTFSDCRLQTIPSALFRYNTLVTDFTSAFSYNPQLTEIPTGFLQYNTLVQNVSYMFEHCPLLTQIPSDFFNYMVDSATTNINNCFNECGISSLNGNLFSHLTNIQSMNGVFNNCNLTALPENLFANNTQLTSMSYMFPFNQLAAIPAALFAHNTLLTSMSNMFQQNQLAAIPASLFAQNNLLTGMALMFQMNQITQIPGTLFANNTQLISLDRMFANNPVTAIPANLFQMQTAIQTSFRNFEAAQITSIPPNLYATCTALTSVTDFYRCSLLESIPNLLFDSNKNITAIYGCFNGCVAVEGETPKGSDSLELWERAGQPGYPASIIGNSCFTGCIKLDNYDLIPWPWK